MTLFSFPFWYFMWNYLAHALYFPFTDIMFWLVLLSGEFLGVSELAKKLFGRDSSPFSTHIWVLVSQYLKHLPWKMVGAELHPLSWSAKQKPFLSWTPLMFSVLKFQTIFFDIADLLMWKLCEKHNSINMAIKKKKKKRKLKNIFS